MILVTASRQNTQTNNMLRSDRAVVKRWLWPLQHHAAGWRWGDSQLQLCAGEAGAGVHGQTPCTLGHMAAPNSDSVTQWKAS